MQSIGKGLGRTDAEDSAAHINAVGAISVDNAVSGDSGPAVDTEYSH